MDKQFYLSTTVQGAVISFLTLLVAILKLDIRESELSQMVAGFFGLLGLVLTVYGRLKAEGRLKVGGRYIPHP